MHGIEEVNFYDATSTVINFANSMVEVTSKDSNILIVENMTKLEVLPMTEEATRWLLDLGAFYHVTPHRSQFRQYTTCNFNSVRVGNSQHCVVIGIVMVELNLPSGLTLVLHNV